MTTKRAKSLLLAMALGAGTIVGTALDDSPRLQIRHGIRDHNYCEAKARLLGTCLGQSIGIYQERVSGVESITFHVTHPYLKYIRGWLYTNGRKRFHRRLLGRLTNEAVAIWYMDQGRIYIKKRQGVPHAIELVLAASLTTIEEATTIASFFEKRYGVQMKVKPTKKGFFLRCGTRHARRLVRSLQPYAIAGMSYKFDPLLENLTGDA